jgi:Kef-type K+ transport system membrane component KefB
MELLGAVSQLGLMLFMFLVGLELNLNEIRGHGRATLLVSHVSIAAPFALGTALALYLYPRVSAPQVGFTTFALFMGAAMSITAFPVLARILSDRQLLRTPLGSMAIACAAINDVSGWCLLAYIVALARSGDSAAALWIPLGGLAAFLLVMIVGVRRVLARVERVYARDGLLSEDLLAGILLLVVAAALTTEALGLHVLFGAFIAGAVMPKDPRLIAYLTEKLEAVAVLFLLPVFFAFSGLRTRIGLDKTTWAWCALIVAAAVLGKLGGTFAAARLGGLDLHAALGLGILMNTRGLMELVVLNVGLDLGVISPALFSMMVLMALVTTFMTTPLLVWLRIPERARIHPAALHRMDLR